MEARRKRFEDLGITRDEINNIGQALQKEEFRKLFVEYCEEVNNPENKKQFETEITELEKQRGVDITFINPEPGFVIKTSVDGRCKAFINVCKNDKVARPTSVPASEEGSRGRQWSLPLSLAPPREDLDKQRKRCTVFDVVFHPDTIKLAEATPEFRKMLINTALDAVEKNCKVHLDRENLKYPKMTFKGLQQAAVIRKKVPNYTLSEDSATLLEGIPYPEDDTWSHVGKDKKQEKKESQTTGYTTPKYIIKYRHGIDMSDYTEGSTARLNATVPKELVLEIELPLLKSAALVSLDVTDKSLSLTSEKPNYKLDLVLPYKVDEDAGNATFDISLRKLSLVLPVRCRTPPLLDTGREDSGVESDQGCRPEDDADEKSRSESSDAGSEGSDQPLVEEITSVVPDDGYRTSPDVGSPSDNSVEKDTCFSLPNFTCNSFENIVALTLHVKNVEANSVHKSIVCEERGIHTTFSSLGGGMFPLYFGFCVVFPDRVRVDPESFSVEVWDNNVVVQIHLQDFSTPITELLVGTGENDLQPQEFPGLAHVEKVLSDLQLTSGQNEAPTPQVEVCKTEPDELTVLVKPQLTEQKSECDKTFANHDDARKYSSVSDHAGARNANLSLDKNRRSAIRQLSECSSEEFNGTKVRGILKKRSVRSLSESNADEYAWLHRSASLSDGLESASGSVRGSELYLGEESCETGCETENEYGDRNHKKTVRFSDVVAQQTFRPNSSILGQRKKNQRKQRNKKRAQDRRASESENSEPESEHEKARRRACFSEGESSDVDVNCGRSKFLKELETQQTKTKPRIKKILRRTNSSDTDEDTSKDIPFVKSDYGDMQGEGREERSKVPPRESSEDERENKTGNIKKKKRQGKKANDRGDQGQVLSKPQIKNQPEFESDLMLDLEV